MRVIIDGMGGDYAPAEIVKGAVEASKEFNGEILIIGDEEAIKMELAQYEYDESIIKTVHATEVITNNEAPVMAIRRKKDSSIVKGLNMVKNGEADVFVSAGSTGALLAGGLFILGRIKGIDRPALASVYPMMGLEPGLLLDAGANAECKPQNLRDFAIMGSLYMEKVLGRENPKVGLVNIGAEEEKGSTLTKEAHQLLKELDINFVGNVEARYIPKGACDVIVADGFTGNIVIKMTEGLALTLLKEIKKKFTDGTRAKLGAIMLQNKLGELKAEFDYSEYGGAPILGVKGPIIKIHGSSKAKAVKNAILKCIPYVEENVVKRIEDAIIERNENEEEC